MELTDNQIKIVQDMNSIGYLLCGSIALYYQGYNLYREKLNDIDFSTNNKKPSKDNIDDYLMLISKMDVMPDDLCSDHSDSYVSFKKDNNVIDILICNYPIKIVKHFGMLMQDKDQILKEKKRYAEKGVIKHQDDLNLLGIKYNYLTDIDLPF